MMSVTAQAVGTLLLGVMLAQLGRIFGRTYATRWAVGWFSLFLALSSVWMFVHLTSKAATWPAYLIFEWIYLLLLWGGCRELATARRLDVRRALYALPVAVVVAGVLTYLAPTFNDLFVPQAAIVAIVMVFSFRALSSMAAERRGTGWWTMRVALVVQGLLFTAYIPLFLYHAHVAKLPLLGYSSLGDLLVSVLLGFSMVLTAAEEANRELNQVASRLDDTRSRLEVKLQTDPLTEALNRHAFYWMQRGDEITTDGVLNGVVVMIDVDNLKQINDDIGHAAGDAVIRTTANSIRALIRADDLLFRWGGDEFVAIVPNSTLPVVSQRLAPLHDGIVAHVSSEHPELRFRVSWGAAEFGSKRSLDEAIRVADQAMYDGRRAEE
jgi:diguanylate cyclase (GGDEF)-like protein